MASYQFFTRTSNSSTSSLSTLLKNAFRSTPSSSSSRRHFLSQTNFLVRNESAACPTCPMRGQPAAPAASSSFYASWSKPFSTLAAFHAEDYLGSSSNNAGSASSSGQSAAAAMMAGMAAGVASIFYQKDRAHEASSSRVGVSGGVSSNRFEANPSEERGNLNVESTAETVGDSAAINTTSVSSASSIATSAFVEQDQLNSINQVVDDLARSLSELHARQKLLQGRVLHDLNQLAEEAISIRLATRKSTRRRSSGHSGSCKKECGTTCSTCTTGTTTNTTGEAFIPIPENLATLTPKQAWHIIQQLQQKHLFENDIYYTDVDQSHKPKVSREDLTRIFDTAANVLCGENTVNDLREREDLECITVVGDLHGQYDSLMDVLRSVGRTGFGPSPPISSASSEAEEDGDINSKSGTPWDGSGAIIFNGDFVDRGEDSLGVLLTVMLLKIAFPNHVYLNRGNHEDALLSTVYGFTEELESLYSTKSDESIDDIWDSIGDAFASIPLCVLTPSSVIMHGGIPSKEFKLDDLRAVSGEERSQIRSLIESDGSPTVELVQNVLWSDPKPEKGIHPNEARGVGVYFGPDVTKDFLVREGFGHFIRSHQPVDMGYETIDTDDESAGAVTVFSAAQFPCGEGYNWGAVLQLTRENNFFPEPKFYPGKRPKKQITTDYVEEAFHELSRVIARNSFQLMSAFRDVSVRHNDNDDGSGRIFVSPHQWAMVMRKSMNLSRVNWMALLPYLVPEAENGGNDDTMIDCAQFLKMHCNISFELDTFSLSRLQQNQTMLMNVFKFLDVDRSGHIDLEEFRVGVELLNRRSKEEAEKIQEPESLFRSIDNDGNGTLDINEFASAFAALSTPYHISCFKKFDIDDSGLIDREEFKSVLKTMNEGLPPNRQIDINNADSVFEALDIDSSGQLDIAEFNQFLENSGYLPKSSKLADIIALA